MKNNVKIAKKLVRLAKNLVAWNGPVNDEIANEVREAILSGNGLVYLDMIREWASNVVALRQAVIEYYKKELDNNTRLNKIQERIDKLQDKMASGTGDVDEILKTIGELEDKLEKAKKETRAYKTLDESDPDSFVSKMIPEYTEEVIKSKSFWADYKGWWEKLTNASGTTGLRFRSIIKGFGEAIAKLAYTEEIFDHDIEVTSEMLDSIKNGISAVLSSSNNNDGQLIHVILGLSKQSSDKGASEANANIIKARIKKGTLMNEWVKNSTKEIRIIITDAENRIAYSNQVENSMMQEIEKAGEEAKAKLKDFDLKDDHIRPVHQDRELAERQGSVQRTAGFVDVVKGFFGGMKKAISFLYTKAVELAKSIVGIDTTELEQAVGEKSDEIDKIYSFVEDQSVALNSALQEFQTVLNEIRRTAGENPEEGI